MSDTEKLMKFAAEAQPILKEAQDREALLEKQAEERQKIANVVLSQLKTMTSVQGQPFITGEVAEKQAMKSLNDPVEIGRVLCGVCDHYKNLNKHALELEKQNKQLAAFEGQGGPAHGKTASTDDRLTPEEIYEKNLLGK